MAKNLFKASYALAIIIVSFCGCKKFEKEGHCQEPGIVLSFDDDRVDNWFEHLAFLDSSGVKATFYICKYNRFTAEQKRKLAIIKAHGHEIAFHSLNHYNMQDYVYKTKHSIDEMMRTEIEAGLKLMNQDGFYPTTFAYPYGAHNGIFDKALMRYFKSVRALNGTQDFSKSIAPTQHNDVLYGLGIDKSSKRSDQDITSVLQSAKNNNGCIVFVSHDINSSISLSTTLKRLKAIISFGKVNNMKFYTVSEISQ
jgi:peptidoglycan/xylan/chitin deacetylase (PgdA/CDA1 family)